MTRKPNQKAKILYVARMLWEETDDDHGLSATQIIDRLKDRGIEAERKSIYSGIKVLESFGFDIVRRKSPQAEYAIGARLFEPVELQLLVDAVQESRFLTQGKRDEMIDRLKKLASVHQADVLTGHLHAEGQQGTANEHVYYAFDAVERALAGGRKVTFTYLGYTVALACEPRHGGKVYCVTPLGLVYARDRYYLIAYSDEHGITAYRVDRMDGVRVSREPAACNEETEGFDLATYSAQTFGMYKGDAVRMELDVDQSVMNAIVDRFGADVESEPVGGARARVSVTVQESPVLYGWLAQFGTKVTVVGPASLAAGYAAHLRAIAGLYPDPAAAGGHEGAAGAAGAADALLGAAGAAVAPSAGAEAGAHAGAGVGGACK